MSFDYPNTYNLMHFRGVRTMASGDSPSVKTDSFISYNKQFNV